MSISLKCYCWSIIEIVLCSCRGHSFGDSFLNYVLYSSIPFYFIDIKLQQPSLIWKKNILTKICKPRHEWEYKATALIVLWFDAFIELKVMFFHLLFLPHPNSSIHPSTWYYSSVSSSLRNMYVDECRFNWVYILLIRCIFHI